MLRLPAQALRFPTYLQVHPRWLPRLASNPVTVRALSSSPIHFGPNPPTPPASESPEATKGKLAEAAKEPSGEAALSAKDGRRAVVAGRDERALRTKAEEEKEAKYGSGEVVDSPAKSGGEKK